MRDTSKKRDGRRKKRSKVFTPVLHLPGLSAFCLWLFFCDPSLSGAAILPPVLASSGNPVFTPCSFRHRSSEGVSLLLSSRYHLFGSFNSEHYSVNSVFIQFFSVKPSLVCHLFCARTLTDAVPIKFSVEGCWLIWNTHIILNWRLEDWFLVPVVLLSISFLMKTHCAFLLIY